MDDLIFFTTYQYNLFHFKYANFEVFFKIMRGLNEDMCGFSIKVLEKLHLNKNF